MSSAAFISSETVHPDFGNWLTCRLVYHAPTYLITVRKRRQFDVNVFHNFTRHDLDQTCLRSFGHIGMESLYLQVSRLAPYAHYITARWQSVNAIDAPIIGLELRPGYFRSGHD